MSHITVIIFSRNFMTEVGKAEGERKMSQDEEVKRKDKVIEDLEEAMKLMRRT